MRFHYLREQVDKGILKLEHCRTEVQVADLLTKGVTVEVFKRLKNLMGVKSLESLRSSEVPKKMRKSECVQKLRSSDM
jgi:hypothetical protein